MNMQPVTSSQIKAVGYEASTRTLAVQFNSGSIYHYANVPPTVYDEFVSAESIGKYFGEHIKGHFDYAKQEAA